MRCVLSTIMAGLLCLTSAVNLRAEQVTEDSLDEQSSARQIEQLNAELAQVKKQISELERELEAANVAADPAASTASIPGTSVSASLTPEPQGTPAVQPLTAEQGKQLAKTEYLLRQGDISGARLLLVHLLPTGNAEVAFRLAQTYDPRWLAGQKVFGIRSDPEKARELYQKAQSGGKAEAKDRLTELR